MSLVSLVSLSPGEVSHLVLVLSVPFFMDSIGVLLEGQVAGRDEVMLAHFHAPSI